MARGFGTTLGTASSDRIVTSSVAFNTANSFAVWAYRNGDGGGSGGRMWEHPVSANSDLLLNSSTGIYQFQRIWSTTTGAWSVTRPSSGAWHHVLVSYDGSSTANDPVIYLDGSVATVTRVTAPAGTINTTAAVMTVGNRAGLDRNWDGMLAELAWWSAALDANEAAALGQGFSPLLVRPTSLTHYFPLIGGFSPENDALGQGVTVTGALRGDHPRVFMPAPNRGRRIKYVAGGVPRQAMHQARMRRAGQCC